MNKVSTAEEKFEAFFSSFPKYGISLANNWKKEIVDIANKLADERAKYYVEEALKQASEKARIAKKPIRDKVFMKIYDISVVDKQSILNAYPLDNIK